MTHGLHRILPSPLRSIFSKSHKKSHSSAVAKPVLYTFGLSVWSAAPELAIIELGYPEDAIETKTIDLAEGANFEPAFLEINPNGTLPTLTVNGKKLRSAKEVVSYLVENAPQKVTKGTSFIDKVHEDQYDPNAPLILARNEEELKAHVEGFPFTFVQNRQNSLEKNADLPAAAEFKAFYNAKKIANGGILAIYKGQVSEEVKQDFFQTSIAHWQNIVNFILQELPTLLPESGFLGGASPGEDDFHLSAWLARIIFFAGGSKEADGIQSLEKETKEPIPAKVAAYWVAWSERASFKKVYENGLH